MRKEISFSAYFCMIFLNFQVASTFQRVQHLLGRSLHHVPPTDCFISKYSAWRWVAKATDLDDEEIFDSRRWNSDFITVWKMVTLFVSYHPSNFSGRINWLEAQLRLYLAIFSLLLLTTVIGFLLYACFYGKWFRKMTNNEKIEAF